MLATPAFTPKDIDAGDLHLSFRLDGPGLHAEPASRHHCWHVNVGTQGTVQKRSGRGGVDGPLFTGAAAFIPAGLPVAWRVSSELRRLVIGLRPQDVEIAGCRHGKGGEVLMERAPAQDPLLDHLVQLLVAELETEGRLLPSFAGVLAPLFTLHLVRRYSTAAAPAAPHSRDRVLQHFVDRYLAGEITVERLAQAVELSPGQLARWMKRELGITPQRFVVRRRLEHAKRLLRTPQFPLADIAIATGFANQPHFTATFRRWIGVTPGEYRSLHQQAARGSA